MSRPAGWAGIARRRVRSALDLSAAPALARYRLGTLAVASTPDERQDGRREARFSAAPSNPTDKATAVDASSSDAIYEDYSEEYRATRLEPRERRPFHPAWPALFPSLLPAEADAPAVPLFTSTGDRLPDFFESDIIVREESAALNLAQTHTIPCDVLARAVYNGDFPLAAQIRHELEATHTPILPRRVYVHAAVQVLRAAGAEQTDSEGAPGEAVQAAQEECLAWFRFVHTLAPGQASSPHGLALTAQLAELGDVALPYATSAAEANVRFTSSLLLMAADKGVGVLAPLLTALIPAITTAYPPHLSHTLLENSIAHASAHAPADASDPYREWFASRPFHWMVSGWRDDHLKALFRAGRTDEAREVFEAGLKRSPPIAWRNGNKWRMLQLLSGEKEGSHKARQGDRDGISTDGTADALQKLYGAGILLEGHGAGKLSGRDILRVSHLRASQPLKNLVDVLDQLEHQGRTTLVERLRKRFVPVAVDDLANLASRYKPQSGHIATDVSASFWHAAEIKRLAAAGRHEQALHVFAREFAWVGLPSTRAFTQGAQRAVELASSTPAISEDMLDVDVEQTVALKEDQHRPALRKLTPNTHVISVMLPSAIASLQDFSAANIAKYHAKYIALNRDAPGSQRPDGVCHLAFVKAYAAHKTAPEVEDYVAGLDEQGVDVGHQAWSFATLQLARKQEISRLHRRLRVLGKGAPGLTSASEGQPVEGSSRQLPSSPKVVPRTFLAPAMELLRRKEGPHAQKILRRMQRGFPQSE